MFADYNNELARGLHSRDPRASCLCVVAGRAGELVGEDEALEAGRHQGAEAVLAVAEDQHVLDAGEVLHEGRDFFGSAGHAGRGKAVRQHTTRGKDCDAEDVRLDRIAGARIDGVSDLLAIHELEVAVVARGRYAPSRRGKLDAHLELPVACRSAFDGLEADEVHRVRKVRFVVDAGM